MPPTKPYNNYDKSNEQWLRTIIQLLGCSNIILFHNNNFYLKCSTPTQKPENFIDMVIKQYKCSNSPCNTFKHKKIIEPIDFTAHRRPLKPTLKSTFVPSSSSTIGIYRETEIEKKTVFVKEVDRDTLREHSTLGGFWICFSMKELNLIQRMYREHFFEKKKKTFYSHSPSSKWAHFLN